MEFRQHCTWADYLNFYGNPTYLLWNCASNIEYSEIVKLYAESLGERKTMENLILPEGPEGRLFMLRNRNTYPQ